MCLNKDLVINNNGLVDTNLATLKQPRRRRYSQKTFTTIKVIKSLSYRGRSWKVTIGSSKLPRYLLRP